MSGELRLALGTAQLGMPYGIANTSGQPDLKTARKIVAACWDRGVRFFDTAQAYERSEYVLGRCFRDLGIDKEAKVVSKLHPSASAADADSAVTGSVKRLGGQALWAFLLHSESMLDHWVGFREKLQRPLRQNLLGRLGASVYAVERASQAVKSPALKAIQLPASIFDRRMRRAGIFERADREGISVFIRSVYLQGLALMDELAVPPFARNAITTYANFCKGHGISRRKFALDYVRRTCGEAVLVIGAETPEQAEENCRLFQEPPVAPELCAEWDEVWPDDQFPLVSPPHWPRK